MRLVYKQKIGVRLGYGFGMVVFLVVLLGIMAIVGMNNSIFMIEELQEHPLTVSNAVRDIRSEIIAIHRSMKDVVLAENTEQVDEAKNDVSKHEERALDAFDIELSKVMVAREQIQNSVRDRQLKKPTGGSHLETSA